MPMNSPMSVRFVARDGSKQTDVTDRSTWELSSVRSGINELVVDVDRSYDLRRYRLWTDFLEFWQNGRLFHRGLLRGVEPGEDRMTVYAYGLLAQLNRRRYPFRTTTLAGFARDIMVKALQDGDAIEALAITYYADGASGGRSVQFDRSPGQLVIDTFTDLAGVYLVVSEHAGAVQIRAIGDEDTGPTLRPHWLAERSACLPAKIDGDAMVNEVAVVYGSGLENYVTYPPAGLPDPNTSGSRLQGPVLEYREVATSAAAFNVAEDAYNRLRLPQIVLGQQSLDPRRVEWDWLRPGRNQVSTLPGAEGIICSLAQVNVTGVGASVASIAAEWDQGDITALRNRVRAR